ncbi:hypothetical protein WJX73_007484 [Symbiochloris irregularis]|uniref:Uncharacterized protein n=1 Tax=Symbiochloris irregularis TaxID=706552 RepID=A0AAW1PSV2_9CHLO
MTVAADQLLFEQRQASGSEASCCRQSLPSTDERVRRPPYLASSVHAKRSQLQRFDSADYALQLEGILAGILTPPTSKPQPKLYPSPGFVPRSSRLSQLAAGSS